MTRRFPRLRFSLRTLVILVLLAGSVPALVLHWDAWYLHLTLKPEDRPVDYFAVYGKPSASFAGNDRILMLDGQNDTYVWNAQIGCLLSHRKPLDFQRLIGILEEEPIVVSVSQVLEEPPDGTLPTELEWKLAERVSFTMDHQRIGRAVQFLNERYHLDVRVGPLGDYPRDVLVVTVAIKDTSLKEALRAVAKAACLELLITKDSLRFVIPDEYHVQRLTKTISIAHVQRLVSGEKISEIRVEGEIRQMLLSLDGKRLLTESSGPSAVRLWNTRTGTLLKTLTRIESLNDAKVSDSATRLAQGTLIYNLEQDCAPVCLKSEHDIGKAEHISPDGRRAVADRRLWDATDGSRLAVLHLSVSGIERPVIFSPDNRRMAVAGEHFNGIFDTATGDRNAMFFGRLDAMEFSPNGTLLITNGTGLLILDADDGSVLATLIEPRPAVAQPFGGREIDVVIKPGCFSPDGKSVAATYQDAVRVWRCRRPEYWWGVAYLPEFWLTVLFVGALGWSLCRDLITFRELRTLSFEWPR